MRKVLATLGLIGFLGFLGGCTKKEPCEYMHRGKCYSMKGIRVHAKEANLHALDKADLDRDGRMSSKEIRWMMFMVNGAPGRDSLEKVEHYIGGCTDNKVYTGWKGKYKGKINITIDLKPNVDVIRERLLNHQ